MKIALLRVDERLIHGQITMSWTRTVGANLILCVNDEVAKNAFQKNLMKMAAPPGTKIEIESIDAAAEKIKTNAWANSNLLILLRNPIDTIRLIEGAGLTLSKINIGGVRSPESTIKLTKEVSATPEELEAWKKLSQMGIRMDVQFLPGEGTTLLNDVLKKY